MELPEDAVEAATKAYCDAWGWSDTGYNGMSSESKASYNEKIKLAIETFIERLDDV